MYLTRVMACRCRFLEPGTPEPQRRPAQEEFVFLYNATCLEEARNELFEAVNSERTGLDRPAEAEALAGADPVFVESMELSTRFMLTN